MSALFEELDYAPTPIGALSLRRRRHLASGEDIYEVKLGDDFLMSSLFTQAEIALADIGLAEAAGGDLDVLVGGLGLGYTAAAALRNPHVRSLLVIEAFAEVIGWHGDHLVPLGETLTDDPRCRLQQGDFFAAAKDPRQGFDPAKPGRRFHAILLDIDHSPGDLLRASNAEFYSHEGLLAFSGHLMPAGVFALWSNDPPDAEFQDVLRQTFDGARAEVVTFDNPVQHGTSTNTIYVATTAA